MPTWKQVADDVLLALGYETDDALRHREAILYNASIIANKLKNQQLKKGAKTGDELGNADMHSTYIVSVIHNDVLDTVVTDFDAAYFDLPAPIMDLSSGSGINAVRYLRNDLPEGCPPAFARNPFTQTTLAALHNIYQSKVQAPNSRFPYMARGKFMDKDRLYLFGVPASTKKLLAVLYTASDFMTLDLDAPADIQPHLLPTLKKMLMDMEAWALQIPQERTLNDGRDFPPGQTVRTRPLMSLNDPAQFDE